MTGFLVVIFIPDSSYLLLLSSNISCVLSKVSSPNNGYEYDSNYVITNSSNWFIDGVEFNEGIPDFTDDIAISDKYRGRRLVRKVKTIYDATIDKYVGVYNEGTIYGYAESEYASPATVRSYVTNASNYESSLGWEVGSDENGSFPTL